MQFTLNSKPTQKPKPTPSQSIPIKSFNPDPKSDSDSDEIKKTNKDLIKSSLYQQAQNSQLSSALSEDPTLLCYDLYKAKVDQEKSLIESNREAKYHDNIKQHAEFKKRERLILNERYESKLRELEKEEFGETEEYFTQSYIEFMKQNKVFELHLDRIDKQSELTSISSKNPDMFLNRLTACDGVEEACVKRAKISDVLDELPCVVTSVSDKRTDSQVQNARDRYLSRKGLKLNNK